MNKQILSQTQAITRKETLALIDSLIKKGTITMSKEKILSMMDRDRTIDLKKNN